MRCGRKSAVFAAILAFGLAGVAAGSRAEPAEQSSRLQVYELVRSLAVLQNRVVSGDQRAHTSQRALLDHIAGVIKASPDADWQDPRNVRAVINFVLSGGDPKVVRPIIGKLAGGEEIAQIAEASVLYAEGQSREARKLFEKIEPRKLDRSLGGHIALVKGALLDGVDRAGAFANLSDARLLSPGTIIEEAALRRSIPIVGRMRNFDQFSYLLARYLRRFGASIYAPGLLPQVAVVIATHRFVNSEDRLARLERVIALSQPKLAQEFYLMLAQTGVAQGDTELVRFASERAAQLSEQSSVDGERAKLYGAAVMVASEQMDEGLARLMSIEKSRLERADAEVADAALLVATAVRQWPDETKAVPPEAGAGEDAMEAFAANQPSQAVKRAKDTLSYLDSVLQELD